MTLPKIPDDVTLPRYGALPRFTKMINGVDWFIVGPDDTIRSGEMAQAARSDGTKSWVQVGEIVADRAVRHRAEVVRYVAARLDPFHSAEYCALCGGEFFVGEGRTPCTCNCHGTSFIERVFDGSPLSKHTHEDRALHALRCLARVDYKNRKADLLIALDNAVQALAGADYREFINRAAVALKTRRKDTTP